MRNHKTKNYNKTMYILMGEAGAGKDAFAKLLERQATAKNKNVVIHTVTFARKLKQELMGLGWDGQKDERGRTFLQSIGKAMKAYHGDSYYASAAFEGMEPKSGVANMWIVTDARFIVEFNYAKEWAKAHGIDVTIIRIDRDRDPAWKSALTSEQKKDVSETEWRAISPDIVIHNDGIDPDFGGQFRI